MSERFPFGLPLGWFVVAASNELPPGRVNSFVNVEVGLFGLEARVWVLPIPIDEEHVDLIIGLTVPEKLGPLSPPLRFIAHRTVCGEVDQDLDIWTYKAFIERPALAKGDGPIATYRKWARQFYPNNSRY